MNAPSNLTALVAEAAEQVVRWVRVHEGWAGHRAEPFAAERLWACTVEGVGPSQAGFDRQGRAVLVGPADRPPNRWNAPPDCVDVAVHAPDGRTVTVHSFGRRVGECRATTNFDAVGRPTSTSYVDGVEDERYEYADDGRLVAIDESPGMLALAPPRWRVTPELWGGVSAVERLSVEWDKDRPVAIRRLSDGEVIWEALADSWPETLRAFAEMLADEAIARLADAARKLGVGPSDEVFALLVDVVVDGGWPTSSMDVWAGLQSTRERLLADRKADAATVEEYLWILQDPNGSSLVAPVTLSEELDRAALRATAMHAPGDVRRTLAQATVSVLAGHDWSAIFTPTPDFVAYVIGFDDDWNDLYHSTVVHNPPGRLAQRAERWRGSPYPPTRT